MKKTLLLLPLALGLAACAGQVQPRPIVGLTIIEAPDDWGPVVIQTASDQVPLRLSESGVSIEGVGSSRTAQIQ